MFDLGEQRVIVVGREHYGGSCVSANVSFFDLSASYICAIYEAVRIVLYIFLGDMSCMEKAMATHSSTLAWQIPWAEEPGRMQSMGSLVVGHN